MSFGGWTDEIKGSGSSFEAELEQTEMDLGLIVGRIFEEDLLVSFDFNYYGDFKLTTNSEDAEIYEKWTDLYFGALIRFYVPYSENLYFYPEVSAGMMSRTETIDATWPTSTASSEWSARGFAFYLGAGAAIKATDNISVDIRARYNGGNLPGDTRLNEGDSERHTLHLRRFVITAGISLLLTK